MPPQAATQQQDGPWADYQNSAGATAGPWADYERPVESPIPPPAVPMPKQDMQPSALGLDYAPEAPGPGKDEYFTRNPKALNATGAVIAGAVPIVGAAAMGIRAATPAIRPIARLAGEQMAKHPLLTYAGIEGAKRLPGLGPMLEKIPGVEYLPFLAGHGEAPGVGRIRKIGEAASKAEEAGAASKMPPDATPVEPVPPTETAQPPVTPVNRPNLPAPYSTEEQAWHRYPAVDSAQDLAETKDIQARVRDQAEGEQRNMLRRGTEEGFARNTRPRTSKGELQKQFQSGKSGVKASGSDYQGVDLNSEKELTDLWKRSLELARKAKPRK